MITVLANAAARGGVPEALARVRRLLGAARYEVLEPDTPAGMREAAAGASDLVVVVGGDGSVRAAAGGLAGRDVPLFVVPAGTGNSTYRELWGESSWEVILSRLASGPRPVPSRRIDLGRVVEGDVTFLLGASAGFLPQTLRATADFPDLSGRELYAAAGLATAQHVRQFEAEVLVDGSSLAAGDLTLVVVGGAQHRAGSFRLLPRSLPDDGLLDVCVCGDVETGRLLELMGKVFEGAHLGEPEISYAQGATVTISASEPVLFETDGDLWPGEDRVLTMEVLPGALAIAP